MLRYMFPVFFLILFLILAGCAGRDADEAAVDVLGGAACMARQSACEDQCTDAFDLTGDTLAYGDCVDSCRANRGRCR